jgi:hypothetical protein
VVVPTDEEWEILMPTKKEPKPAPKPKKKSGTKK